MKKRARRRKIGTIAYWLFLFIFMAALSFAAFVGLTIVWNYAEEYENAVETRAIDAYVAEFRRTGWTPGLNDAIAAMPHEVQTNEECAEKIKEILLSDSSNIEYGYRESYNFGKTVTYRLRDGYNKAFGVITMEQDESVINKLKFKNLVPWKIVKEEFVLDSIYSYAEATAPSTYSVYLNGVKLDKEYIVEDDIHYDVLKDFEPYLIEKPTKVRYFFDHCFGELTPVIKNEAGEEVVIDENNNDMQFLKPCDPDTESVLNDYCTRFAACYTSYFAGYNYSSALAELAQFVDKGSDLDYTFEQMIDGRQYIKIAVYNQKPAEFYAAYDMGNGQYLCDVSVSYTAAYQGQQAEDGVNNYRILCTYNDGVFRAVRVENI